MAPLRRLNRQIFEVILLFASSFAFCTEYELAPKHWPEHPLLSCPERRGYAHSFALMAKQGVPEERIIIAETFEPPEAREEVREIRRRAYREPEALHEVLACGLGPSI